MGCSSNRLVEPLQTIHKLWINHLLYMFTHVQPASTVTLPLAIIKEPQVIIDHTRSWLRGKQVSDRVLLGLSGAELNKNCQVEGCVHCIRIRPASDTTLLRRVTLYWVRTSKNKPWASANTCAQLPKKKSCECRSDKQKCGPYPQDIMIIPVIWSLPRVLLTT